MIRGTKKQLEGVKTCYVQAKDKKTGKSRTMTFYGYTPVQLIRLLEKAVNEDTADKTQVEHAT